MTNLSGHIPIIDRRLPGTIRNEILRGLDGVAGTVISPLNIPISYIPLYSMFAFYAEKTLIADILFAFWSIEIADKVDLEG